MDQSIGFEIFLNSDEQHHSMNKYIRQTKLLLFKDCSNILHFDEVTRPLVLFHKSKRGN